MIIYAIMYTPDRPPYTEMVVEYWDDLEHAQKLARRKRTVWGSYPPLTDFWVKSVEVNEAPETEEEDDEDR